MSTIAPGRFLNVSNLTEFVSASQDNWLIASEEIYLRPSTYVSGVQTTTIGPPTTGAHIEDEIWRDALEGEWRCTVAATPGTWKQITPAPVATNPSSGTIPTGYLVLNVTDGVIYEHAGAYAWTACVGSHQHVAADVTDLGDSATCDVGTGAGDVAAGDHTHAGLGEGRGCMVVLCAGFTPSGTGADVAEIPAPYDPADGTTSITWTLKRATLRVNVAGGAPAVTIEKSTAAGAFSATSVATLTMGSGDYEVSTNSASATVASGNKLRFNVDTLGTAAGWTITLELEET